MREQGIDLWLLVAHEYFEEPVVASMLDAESMHARRRTILIFHDPGNGQPVERLLTVIKRATHMLNRKGGVTDLWPE